MNPSAPIRSRAAEEGNFEIPLWGIPFILLILYVCLFSGLGALGLVGPDEPRYAAIARSMAETHDWITPRLWSTPWFEKPVLYYWSAGIAMRLFGVSEFAARLPSALAALLAVVAIKWIALRSYGVSAAWYSLLMLPTSVAMIGFARAASPDMLFAGLLTASMAVACEILQRPSPGPILRVAFGLFLGAAVLAKGPAAVILAGGATLLWAALSRQWLAPFRFLHPLIIAVFCATALPWYILCALRNPDFLRVFIWEHNFQRYLTPVFQHPQPFWFFGLIILLGILPWFPLLISGFFQAALDLRREDWKNSPALFIGCWAAFTLLFFSLSQSKLPGYILPAVPPAVLLIATSFVRQIQRQTRGIPLAIAAVGFVFPLLVGVLYARPILTFGPGIGLDPDPTRGLLAALATSVVGGGLVAGVALFRRWTGALCVATCTIAVVLLIANRMVMPGLDTFISSRPAAQWLIKARKASASEVAVYNLPRAYGYGLNYYFGAEIHEWTPEDTKAEYLFLGTGSQPALDQSPQFVNSRAGSYIPATSDGKIELLFGRQATK